MSYITPTAPPVLIASRGLLRDGLICQRAPAWSGRIDDRITPVAATNVLQQLWPYGDCGLDWHGPYHCRWSLALCVLDAYLPPDWGEIIDDGVSRQVCSRRAWLLHRLFGTHVLLKISYWGGVIPAADITAWIAAFRVGDDDADVDLSSEAQP